MKVKHFAFAVVVLISTRALAQAAPTARHAVAGQASPAAAGAVPTTHEGEGDRIFQQNCSRCHNAPEGFSPRISGTVVRHMRVRASLSRHEEQELMRFLNP